MLAETRSARHLLPSQQLAAHKRRRHSTAPPLPSAAPMARIASRASVTSDADARLHARYVQAMHDFTALAVDEISATAGEWYGTGRSSDLGMILAENPGPKASPSITPTTRAASLDPLVAGLTPLDVGHEVAMALRMPKSSSARTTRGSDGQHRSAKEETMRRTLDSMERAERGKVLIPPNRSNPSHNSWFSELTSAEEVRKVLTTAMARTASATLSAKYLDNRHSYLTGYSSFMREVVHQSPWRLTWAGDLTKREVFREESWQLAYAHYNRIRYETAQSVAEAATHVRQFHLVNLQLVQPNFVRLSNLLRLLRLQGKRRNGDRQRRRRPTLKPKHVLALCTMCERHSQNTELSLADRVSWAVLGVIISGGFQLLYRVGELAVGASFDPKLHFTVAWLRVLETLLEGEDALLFHSKRKVENEFTAEQFPVLCDRSPANFVTAYQNLRHIRPGRPDEECAFALASGLPPTAAWVCESLRTLMRALFPDEAHGMDYTDHCLRRGGEVLMVYLKVDPKLQEQMGCWSADSTSRQLYMARVRQTLVSIQRGMFAHDYDLMQDDFQFVDDVPRGAAAAAAAPPGTGTCAHPSPLREAPSEPEPASDTTLEPFQPAHLPAPDDDHDSVVSAGTDTAAEALAACDDTDFFEKSDLEGLSLMEPRASVELPVAKKPRAQSSRVRRAVAAAHPSQSKVTDWLRTFK